MAAEKGKPSKKYPQISLTRDVYDELWDLKFDLRKSSINDLVEYLIKEHKRIIQKEDGEAPKNE